MFWEIHRVPTPTTTTGDGTALSRWAGVEVPAGGKGGLGQETHRPCTSGEVDRAPYEGPTQGGSEPLSTFTPERELAPEYAWITTDVDLFAF